MPHYRRDGGRLGARVLLKQLARLCPNSTDLNRHRSHGQAITPLSRHVDKNAPTMAFGQQLGPPASARQIRELLALLKDAGHIDFRDARGPMGFTQRQAAGRFARDEAAVFIGQLLDAESDGSTGVALPGWRQSAQEQMMSSTPSGQLAGELRRRGWTVIEP